MEHNKTLEDLKALEHELNKLSFNSSFEATLYARNSIEVQDAARQTNSSLIYPDHDLYPTYYWFTYQSKLNSRIMIKVQGPLVD